MSSVAHTVECMRQIAAIQGTAARLLQVNEAIRAEVERRLLTGMLDSLDAEYGPVDEALVAKYMELL
jgi:hypothetical protein